MPAPEQKLNIVALVDNDPKILAYLAAEAINAGIMPKVYNSKDFNLLDLVQQILNLRPDAVVTGMRNINDSEPEDYSGAYLAEALVAQGIPVLLASSNERDYVERTEDAGAVFIPKVLGATVIIERVLQILEQE